MIIGSILEDKNLDQRIAITPEIIKKYKSLGFVICLTKGYGKHLGINDDEFEKEGAEIEENDSEVISKSNLLLQLNILNEENLNKLKKDQILFGVLNKYSNMEKLKILKEKIIVFLLNFPRITRAQSMDILSSQANLAGYKAVVIVFLISKQFQ